MSSLTNKFIDDVCLHLDKEIDLRVEDQEDETHLTFSKGERTITVFANDTMLSELDDISLVAKDLTTNIKKKLDK